MFPTRSCPAAGCCGSGQLRHRKSVPPARGAVSRPGGAFVSIRPGGVSLCEGVRTGWPPPGLRRPAAGFPRKCDRTPVHFALVRGDQWSPDAPLRRRPSRRDHRQPQAKSSGAPGARYKRETKRRGCWRTKSRISGGFPEQVLWHNFWNGMAGRRSLPLLSASADLASMAPRTVRMRQPAQRSRATRRPGCTAASWPAGEDSPRRISRPPASGGPPTTKKRSPQSEERTTSEHPTGSVRLRLAADTRT